MPIRIDLLHELDLVGAQKAAVLLKIDYSHFIAGAKADFALPFQLTIYELKNGRNHPRLYFKRSEILRARDIRSKLNMLPASVVQGVGS